MNKQKKAETFWKILLLTATLLPNMLYMQSLAEAPGKKAETWIVSTENGDFQTIQEAINAANPGDTIIVREGTYHEHVIINKTLTLTAENNSNPTIDGDGTGTVVKITADNVTLKGFKIQNSSLDGPLIYSSGILIFSSFCTIEKNHVENTQAGIYLYQALHSKVKENTVENSAFYNILLDFSHYNLLEKNVAVEAEFGIGLDSSHSNMLRENNVSKSQFHGVFIYSYIQLPCGNNKLMYNRIDKSLNGVYLAYSHGNILKCNIISHNNSTAIHLESCQSNIVTENIAKFNKEGVRINGCNNTQFTNNTISSNNIGVTVKNSRNVTFYFNNLIGNQKPASIASSTEIFWNLTYPLGGNYWSSYTGGDFYAGPFQNETGSDGIGDTPYAIDESNVDNYPLMKPCNSSIGFFDLAVVKFSPSETLLYIGEQVDFSITLRNEGTLAVNFTLRISCQTILGEEQVQQFTLSLEPFSSTTIMFYWTEEKSGTYIFKAQIIPVFDEVEEKDNMLTVSVAFKKIGDINNDNIVDIRDLALISSAFGSYTTHKNWNPEADFNRDQQINLYDILLLLRNLN